MCVSEEDAERHHCTNCEGQYILVEGEAPIREDKLFRVKTLHQVIGIVCGLGVGYLVF